MTFPASSNSEIREILLNTSRFSWPTFDHTPLNCFDLTSAVLTFPGDISESRIHKNSGYADYQVDIGDVNSCLRMDEFFGIELWNEQSLTIPWILGRLNWSCMVDVSESVLLGCNFYLAVVVARFQNIADIDDLTDVEQLKRALFGSLQEYVDSGSFQPIAEEMLFSKVINGRTWVIARSLNHNDSPTYKALSAINQQAVILIPATLSGGWPYDEAMPDEVEKKYLASFWDFLGHIHLTHSRDDIAAGSVPREAPGQAEKIDDLPEW